MRKKISRKPILHQNALLHSFFTLMVFAAFEKKFKDILETDYSFFFEEPKIINKKIVPSGLKLYWTQEKK